MKSRIDLDQGRQSTLDVNCPASRLHDAAYQFEDRAFSSSVGADDAKRFAAREREAHVLKRPEFPFLARGALPSNNASDKRGDQIAQGIMQFSFIEALGDVLDVKHNVIAAYHMFSANIGSHRLNR